MPHTSHEHHMSRGGAIAFGAAIVALVGGTYLAIRPQSGHNGDKPYKIYPTASPSEMLQAARITDDQNQLTLNCRESKMQSVPVGFSLEQHQTYRLTVVTQGIGGVALGYDQLDIAVESDPYGVSINEAGHDRVTRPTSVSVALPFLANPSDKIQYDAVYYTVVGTGTAGEGQFVAMCNPSGIEQATKPTVF